MSDKTEIQWSDSTWNPTYGCDKVSPGCANCYIERTPPYRMQGLRFEKGHIPVQLHHDRLDLPLRWRKPRRIFVNALSDLFHEDVPDEFIDQVFAVMALTPQHTYQVLTKRPERMQAYMTGAARENVALAALGMCFDAYAANAKDRLGDGVMIGDDGLTGWPLPNVWLGVTVENQTFADRRIPLLLATPAAVRFLSCEPLLGPLKISRYVGIRSRDGSTERTCLSCGWPRDRQIHHLPYRHLQHPDELAIHEFVPGVDWVIAGGESGGPENRRLVEPCRSRFDGRGDPCPDCHGTGWRPKPHALEWARSLRDQCVEAGVPFFWKQNGGPTPKSGGRLLDGRTWDEMPEDPAH